MKFRRTGLVLSGGGARGGYQLGVFFALYKYHLIPNILALSGASIGALMEIIFLDGNFKKAYHLFETLDNDLVLGTKNDYKSRIPIPGQGVFSRSHLINFINTNYNLEEISKTQRPCYISATKVKRKLFDVSYYSTYFRLNNKNPDVIMQYLLASSAIPYVFDQVEIKGDKYADALRTDNEPVTPLLKYSLDSIIVIPLSATHSVERFEKLELPVIDFMCEELFTSPKINMLDFDHKKMVEFISLGYIVGDTLLNNLKQKGVFNPFKHQNQKYYSLKTEKISIDIKKTLSLYDIIKDSRYKGD